MSLTLGTGPLGSKPGGDFNFGLDGAPAHRLYFEPFPRRVRALVDDRIVLDSTRGRLLFESNLGAAACTCRSSDLDSLAARAQRRDLALPVQGRRLPTARCASASG